MLRFSDGVKIDPEGELRTLHLADGWYVVGEGYCWPVREEAQAKQVIDDLKKARGERWQRPGTS